METGSLRGQEGDALVKILQYDTSTQNGKTVEDARTEVNQKFLQRDEILIEAGKREFFVLISEFERIWKVV